MIHFCIIYFASGSSKLLGGYWWNGVAVYYTMANPEFAPLHRPGYLADNCMAGGAPDTLGDRDGGRYVQHRRALELSLPFLVWNKRLRPFLVAWSMLLHISIAIFMGLVAFSLLMATMVMAFIPGDALAPLVERLRKRLIPDARPSAELLPPSEPAEEAAHESASHGGEPEPALAGVGESTAITDRPGKRKGKGDKHKKSLPDSEGDA